MNDDHLLIASRTAAFVTAGLFSIAVHEGGHWAAARLAGFRVALVRIGKGPRLWCARFGLTFVVLHLIPTGGITVLYPAFCYPRMRYVFFIAGGSLANISFCVVSMATLPLWRSPSWLDTVILMSLIMQVVGALQVLLPFKSKDGQPFDGRQILTALFNADRGEQAEAALYTARVGHFYASAPDGARSPSSLGGAVLFALDPQAEAPHAVSEQARWLRLALLARPTLTIVERVVLLDSLVTAALLDEPWGRLDELDVWSRDAAALLPDETTIQASRAAVLVLRGQPEGRRLLLADLRRDQTTFDRALRCLFLAWAAADDGDLSSAAALLDEARSGLVAIPNLGPIPVQIRLEARMAILQASTSPFVAL